MSSRKRTKPAFAEIKERVRHLESSLMMESRARESSAGAFQPCVMVDIGRGRSVDHREATDMHHQSTQRDLGQALDEARRVMREHYPKRCALENAKLKVRDAKRALDARFKEVERYATKCDAAEKAYDDAVAKVDSESTALDRAEREAAEESET